MISKMLTPNAEDEQQDGSENHNLIDTLYFFEPYN